MRVTPKGQVTIPAELREKAGLLPGTEVDFRFDGNVVTIAKVQSVSKPTRGVRLVAQMRGTGDVAMTTDEIISHTRGE